MSQMMIWDSKEQEIRVRLAARENINFNHYRLLCLWLDSYTYILPNDRKLIDSFRSTLPFSSASKLFKFWLYLDKIESTLNTQDQDKLCQLSLLLTPLIKES